MKTQAVITIDDGPSKAWQPRANHLDDLGVKAIWFCTGTNLDERPDAAKHLVRRGHLIANHSYEHRAFSDLSESEARRSIQQTEEHIETVYEETPRQRDHKLFRFPYGDRGEKHRERNQRILAELGFTNPLGPNVSYDWWEEYGLNESHDTFWTFDPKEYRDITRDAIKQRINDNNPEQGGSLQTSGSNDIILLHDIPQHTDDFHYALKEINKVSKLVNPEILLR
jgi:peptidoglycan/xylan/chitin deacetylase (PgdA/CDA1 family)